MNWESCGIALLSASVVRPLILVAVAWVMLRVLRVRHPASRHAVWTAVLIGMVLLPFVTVFAPHWMVPVLPAKRAIVVQAVVRGTVNSGSVAAFDRVEPVLKSDRPWSVPPLIWCYLAGLLAVIAYRMAGWILLWRVVSRAARVRGRIRESDDVLTPVAAGVLRPVVILPAGWREWNANVRRAVLAHEYEHIRRHDTSVSALAGWITCALWFHPLAWWVSRQMAELAELACDAAALKRTGDPAGYSRMLLGFASAVNRTGHRVTMPGLAMAAGSSAGRMDRRIDSVFQLSGQARRKWKWGGLVLALTGLPVMCLAATVGLSEHGGRATQKSVSNQSSATVLSPPSDLLIGQQKLIVQQSEIPKMAVQPAQDAAKPSTAPDWQTKAGAKMLFEVASVKPDTGPFRSPNFPLDAGEAYRPVGGHFFADFALTTYITFAYKLPLTSGQRQTMLAHLPGWVASDRFEIQAEANGNPTKDQMRLMVQSLLAERFKLAVHFETQMVPVLALVLEKPGKTGTNLRPHSDGVPCEASPATSGVPTQDKNVFPPVCDVYMMQMSPNANARAGSRNTTMGVFAGALPGIGQLDRPVIDQTGLIGRFDFSIDFAPESAAPSAHNAEPPADVRGPTFLEALHEQLGLKLESTSAPLQILVVDNVDRPSEN